MLRNFLCSGFLPLQICSKLVSPFNNFFSPLYKFFSFSYIFIEAATSFYEWKVLITVFNSKKI